MIAPLWRMDAFALSLYLELVGNSEKLVGKSKI